ncbi:hypothetical protein Zm00014a_011849 [Zea mays]|uniref:Uncharacterized protein n=1 Tax=Zea mays TaxID=4577 RepID=A0A3L6FD52_MAIZE|nr:hypothetical protein Zm00014a_011849 [Zea mays]
MAVLERRSRLPAVAQLAVAFWLAATSACLCRSVIPDPDLEPGRPSSGDDDSATATPPYPSVLSFPSVSSSSAAPPAEADLPTTDTVVPGVPAAASIAAGHHPSSSDAATSIPYPSSMYLSSVLSSSATGLIRLRQPRRSSLITIDDIVFTDRVVQWRFHPMQVS